MTEKYKLFSNGNIYTVAGDDWDKNPVEALIVDSSGKIVYTGTQEGVLKYAASPERNFGVTQVEKIDLEGKTVLPGFVESHVHMPGSSLTELQEMYLYKVRTIDELLQYVAEFVKAHPDRETYFGTGFFISISDGPDGLRKEWLDKIVPDKPVLLRSSDGHTIWLNSAALDACGITVDSVPPPGGRLPIDPITGELTGVVSDAITLINLTETYTVKEEVEALAHYQQKLLSWGYTSAMHIAPHFCSPEAFLEINKSGKWNIKVNLSTVATPEDTVNAAIDEIHSYEIDFKPYNQIKNTTIKFFEDGVVEGKTAYLVEPYANSDGLNADPIWDLQSLTLAFAQVMRAGYQIHVHSIGDAATKETLDALAAAAEIVGDKKQRRDVITHLQVVREEDIKRMSETGVIASHQPFWHCKEPDWFNEIDLALLGADRAEASYPVGSMAREGVKITFSGDYPASPIDNPFWAMETAVTRNVASEERYGIKKIKTIDDTVHLRNPKERISLKEAIEAYTINGAYQLLREDEIGSIESGKSADFIVVDQDPFAINPLDLDGIKILATYIDGEMVWSRN
jgi:predicted amidohydrolase YtcJ